MKPSLPELQRELQQLDAKRRQLRKAIKAAKPKPRKVVSQSERDRAAEWVNMLPEAGFCWACGRTRNDRPTWWGFPFWGIERMHFVHSGTGRRIKDRRLVILACSGCHGHYHDNLADWDLPRLTDGQCVLLKSVFDPDWYSPEFIADSNTRGVILPEELPNEFMVSFARFQV
jgi:hypothetical protein